MASSRFFFASTLVAFRLGHFGRIGFGFRLGRAGVRFE